MVYAKTRSEADKALAAAAKDPLVQAIQKQVYEDDIDFGHSGIRASVELSPAGVVHVTTNDPIFPVALPLADLQRAAQSVTGGAGLLGRPGILDVVLVVLDVNPASAVTLTHKMERALVQFDINGHDIAASIEQDRKRSRDGAPAPKIRGAFETAPTNVVGTGPGRVFTVQGGENELSFLSNEGIGYFRRVLELVEKLRPPAAKKNGAQRQYIP